MKNLVLLAALLPCPSQADCRLALSLAVDVSRSVDAKDYEIQRGGIIDALNAPDIRAAFLRPAAHVSLSVFEWSGMNYQAVIVPWIEVRNDADLDAVIALMAAQQRPSHTLPTALGFALEYGLALMGNAPRCDRQVIDVSGDGQNNDGIAPATAYRRNDFGEIVVNGMAIGEHENGIQEYYRAEVLHGPGAFVEYAPKQVDFPPVIRRKLLRELTEQVLGDLGPAAPKG